MYFACACVVCRYEEYPRLKELTERKDALVANTATPPYCLKADLRTLKLSTETFGTKFDVILVDPPWEEYVRRAPGELSGAEVRSRDHAVSHHPSHSKHAPCLRRAASTCSQVWILTNGRPNRFQG